MVFAVCDLMLEGWKIAVEENSGGVYLCEGFAGFFARYMKLHLRMRYFTI